MHASVRIVSKRGRERGERRAAKGDVFEFKLQQRTPRRKKKVSIASQTKNTSLSRKASAGSISFQSASPRLRLHLTSLVSLSHSECVRHASRRRIRQRNLHHLRHRRHCHRSRQRSDSLLVLLLALSMRRLDGEH